MDVEEILEAKDNFSEAQIDGFKRIFTDEQKRELQEAEEDMEAAEEKRKKDAAARRAKEEMEKTLAEGGGEPEGLEDLSGFELAYTIWTESRDWMEFLSLFFKYFN